MISQELLDYVNQQLIYGTSIEEIKRALLDTGWQENDVNDAISQTTNLFPETIKPVGTRRILSKKLLILILIGVLIIGGGALGYFNSNRNRQPTPPTTQAKFIFNRDLSFGMQNDNDVKELQKKLAIENCYPGTTSGNFDALTREAVKCFQQKYKFSSIPDSGFIGPYTRTVLNEGISVVINPPPVQKTLLPPTTTPAVIPPPPPAKKTTLPVPTPTPVPVTPPPQKLPEKIANIVYDGQIYSQGPPDGYRISRKFYETHPDVYDFIIVYSAIPTNFNSANGLTVKNGIRGNGSFFPDQDDTAKYGSNGKLLGYVFIPTSLGLDAGGEVDLLEILAHEVSHHWLMFIGDSATCKDNPNSSVKCSKTPTGFRVSRDGAHWSSNVDTLVRENGVVFKNPIGGSALQMNTDGYCSLVSATGNGVRFNDLDLYLMGFLPASEAKSIYWYDITDASDLGQKCTQNTIGVQDIINIEGARQPAYPSAQRDFKVAFILLTAPGQSATSQQISRMNYIINNFSETWYQATRKTSKITIPQ